MSTLRKIVTTAALGLMAVVALPSVASAIGGTENVAEVDVTRQAEGTAPKDVWVIYNRAGGQATFRDGPQYPPINNGSLELSTPTATDKVWIFNYEHIGAKLSDINALSYYTYRTQGSAQQVASLNLEVDINGPDVAGGLTTLVFEPVYNTSEATFGSVVNDVWQRWDGYKNGKAVWWSSEPIEGLPDRNTFVSWSTILNLHPNATIAGGVGINQGSGNPGLITAVDGFTLGYLSDATEYDFELVSTKPPVVVATDKEQCKKYGWRDNFPVGTYKNQGHCVSSVVSQGKHANSRAEDVVEYFEAIP